MARTVNEIKESIAASLQTTFKLSASAVAEWRLWVHVAALAIYTFEIILDQFRGEVENKIIESRQGTLKWYQKKALEFQNGYELIYNPDTGNLSYTEENPAARIIAVSSVFDENGTVVFQVAKNEGGELVKLTPLEILNFENYIEQIKFAGTKTSVISINGDLVYYYIFIVYDPAFPQEIIEKAAAEKIEDFRTSQQFGGVLFPDRFTDFIMQIDGVVTAKLYDFTRKGANDEEPQTVHVAARLDAGYFNYTDDCILKVEPLRNLSL